MIFRRNIIFLFIILFISISILTIQAQNLSGRWVDRNYNVELILLANGSYTLQYPNGYSQGQYGLSGQTFCLQDASGTPPVCYTVVSFSNNKMILRDVNGLLLNYVRQGGHQQNNLPQSNTGEILAQKNNQVLRMDHFNAGIGIIQFIIGQSIKPSELKELKAKLIEEFHQAPEEVLRQLNSLGQSLQTVRSCTDPLKIGLTRQELFSALYKATRNFKESDKPLMIQVMNRYIKVLEYDAANNLVLTNRDVEGLLKYLAFNSELMGQKIQLTPSLEISITADLKSRFTQMSIEQKRILCSASLIWQVLETNWNKMTNAQQQQYKNAYYSQIGQKAPSYQTYQTEKTSNTPKSTADTMREYRAKQHMFQMMNEMNMNSHALSLNIIENIGGTGNYWQVVDY